MANIILEKFVEDQLLQKSKWESWQHYPVTEDHIMQLATSISELLAKSNKSDVLEVKKQIIKTEVMNSVFSESLELGNNVLGLMNGITHFCTHWLMSNHSFLTDRDPAFRINQFASRFCESIVNKSMS